MAGLADKELPTGMAYEWTEMAYFEVQAGNTAMTIFAVAVLMVFLVLAAQYESWSLPLAVILVVPMCLLSAIVGVSVMPPCCVPLLDGAAAATADINIFTQIGFVVLVGLASKNAILIVEFAKHQREEGLSRHEATLAACKLRLRPIVMTSAAFILGARAAVDRQRRRRRDAADPGHRRLQRHVGRDRSSASSSRRSSSTSSIGWAAQRSVPLPPDCGIAGRILVLILALGAGCGLLRWNRSFVLAERHPEDAELGRLRSPRMTMLDPARTPRAGRTASHDDPRL